jgi:hypothetical protein
MIYTVRTVTKINFDTELQHNNILFVQNTNEITVRMLLLWRSQLNARKMSVRKNPENFRSQNRAVRTLSNTIQQNQRIERLDVTAIVFYSCSAYR